MSHQNHCYHCRKKTEGIVFGTGKEYNEEIMICDSCLTAEMDQRFQDQYLECMNILRSMRNYMHCKLQSYKNGIMESQNIKGENDE